MTGPGGGGFALEEKVELDRPSHRAHHFAVIFELLLEFLQQNLRHQCGSGLGRGLHESWQRGRKKKREKKGRRKKVESLMRLWGVSPGAGCRGEDLWSPTPRARTTRNCARSPRKRQSGRRGLPACHSSHSFQGALGAGVGSLANHRLKKETNHALIFFYFYFSFTALPNCNWRERYNQ